MWRTRKQKHGEGPKLSSIQYCEICGKRLKPAMKITKDPENWIWLECDSCMEPICEECSDIVLKVPKEPIDEMWHVRICVTCMNDPHIENRYKWEDR